MRQAFTLVEIIVVIVIAAILGGGTYVFMEQMLKRAVKAEFVTQKSLQTQAAIDQLAYMLKARVVNSTVRYDGTDIEPILNSNDGNFTTLMWIGEDVDLKYSGAYSGFIDLDASTQNNLIAMNFNLSNATEYAIIFSGFDDRGDGNYTSYGWHDSSNEKVYPITGLSQVDNDNNDNIVNITIDGSPSTHYEKYYLVKSGYALTRGEDLNKTIFEDNCELSTEFLSDFDNTLFLFYDFKPWEGETFCADSGVGAQAGKVTVLLDEVTAFEAQYDGISMILKVQVEKDNTLLSKTKAVF